MEGIIEAEKLIVVSDFLLSNPDELETAEVTEDEVRRGRKAAERQKELSLETARDVRMLLMECHHVDWPPDDE